METLLKTKFLGGLLLLSLTGCSTSPSALQISKDGVPAAPSQNKACVIWTRQLFAHISHTSITPDGRLTLVSTSAEKRTQAGLRLFNSQGKLLWFRPLPQPARAQAISADGAIIATSTYDGRLRAFSRNGNKLWEAEHLGRPVIFAKSKRVLLFNDDDSEPKMAFIVFDYKGRKISTVTFKNAGDEEPLDMFVSDDESSILVTTSSNNLIVYDVTGKQLQKSKMPGSSISIAATGGAQPRIYALTSNGSDRRSQRLTAFEPDSGESLQATWSESVGSGFEVAKLVNDQIILYGNLHGKQSISGFSIKDGDEAWKRSYPTPAAYTSLVFASESYATIALDEGHPAGTLRIAGINNSGNATWNAHIKASHGIFSFGLAAKRQGLVVGAGQPGNGTVSYLEPRQNCAPSNSNY